MTDSTPAIVIGAGPYGLSVAAHLKAHGIGTRVFGDVMSSWRTQMPVGMCLKSTPDASSLSAPVPGFTLPDYCRSQGIAPLQGDDVVPIGLFTRYGQWFQQQLVPGVEEAGIQQLSRTGRGFQVTLSSGEELQTRHVVVATGITGLAYVPDTLASVEPDGPSAAGLVSHTSQHSRLSGFSGARVAVIGPASRRWKARPCCMRPEPRPRSWPGGRPGSGLPRRCRPAGSPPCCRNPGPRSGPPGGSTRSAMPRACSPTCRRKPG